MQSPPNETSPRGCGYPAGPLTGAGRSRRVSGCDHGVEKATYRQVSESWPYDLVMPFDLTSAEPPVLSPRSALSAERRLILRRAIGEESIRRAAALRTGDFATEVEDPGHLIRLHPSGLVEDLKHDWLPVTITDLFDAIAEVASIKVSDDTAVGHELRSAAYRLLSRAEAVSELVQFLDMFESSVVHTLIRPAAISALQLAGYLIDWMTCETDEESASRAESFDAAAGDLRDERAILCALPFSDRLTETEPANLIEESEFELLLGVKFPTDATRWTDVLRRLEADYDLCELGSRQLPYFGAYEASDSTWARNFFQLGLRIGQSGYPLLAHRSAFLAWQLIQRATAADEPTTLTAIHGLLDSESAWMTSSQEDYFGALERYRAGDRAAIVEAYGDLAEGTLRRYGSLVVALERITAGETVQSPLVLKDIGDLEDQLGVWQAELLPALILRFLARELRNAEAHANVIVDGQGTLHVKSKDGTVLTAIPNHVYGATAGLRSVLDGIDIAVNHTSIQDTEKKTDLLSRPVPLMSDGVFRQVVERSAEEHTQGYVSGVTRDGEKLIMTYHGPSPRYTDLKAFADSLIRLLEPNLPTIHIVDEDGRPIEIFRPPTQHATAGRNDPCPCGSGKKYKRCHGA